MLQPNQNSSRHSQKLTQNKQQNSQQGKKQQKDLEQSNPFKMKINSMEMSNPFKINMNQMEASNLFRMNMNSMEMSNPFQMKLGGHDKDGFFFKQDEKQVQIIDFNVGESNNREDIVKFNSGAYGKLLKSQSKQENNHSQQNIKKYRDILRIFYNNKYCQTVKNFEQSRRKYKKQSSHHYNSGQIKKPDSFFKAYRLAFNRENKTKTTTYQKLQQYYLVTKIKQSKIVIYQLKQPNIRNLKPIIININYQQNIANSIEYDLMYGRIFYFSNTKQEIVVIGTKARQTICRVKLRYQRINPLLYINKYKSNLYLLVAGGYNVLNNSSIVEGCKYIEIFRIDKWEISLKQVALRLSIGRITPIIFSCDHENEQTVFIIGGCSNASLNNKKQLIYNLDEGINFSTNQTAVKIDSSFMEDCFQAEQSNNLLINNINVRFDNPIKLYGGTVLYRKLVKTQKYQLFLPNTKSIYRIKTLKNDIHIIESQLAIDSLVHDKDGRINRQIGYHRDSTNMYQLYQINLDGNLCLQHVHINQCKSQKKLQQSFQCIIM